MDLIAAGFCVVVIGFGLTAILARARIARFVETFGRESELRVGDWPPRTIALSGVGMVVLGCLLLLTTFHSG